METIVKIMWDKPQEKEWLCADNIKIALSEHCKNTNFEVINVDISEIERQQKFDSLNELLSLTTLLRQLKETKYGSDLSNLETKIFNLIEKY